jgi:hypothetical protein
MAGLDLFGLYLEIIKGLNGHLAIRHSIDIPTYVAVFCILSYTSLKIVYRSGPLSMWHGICLGWWWRRWPVCVEGSCKYIEQVMGVGGWSLGLGVEQSLNNSSP